MVTWPIINRAGGQTKTTSTINLQSELVDRGFRVVSIDLDPRCALTTLGGVSDTPSERSTLAALLPERYGNLATTREMLVDVSWGGQLLPAHPDLVGADEALKEVAGPHQRLDRALASLREEFDIVLVDCPPATGKLTFNALGAADGLLIPVVPSFASVAGLEPLFRSIQLFREYEHPELSILGVFAALVRSTRHARETFASLRSKLGDLLFDATVPVNVKVEDAQLEGLAARQLDSRSKSALAYASLASEILERAELSIPTMEMVA